MRVRLASLWAAPARLLVLHESCAPSTATDHVLPSVGHSMQHMQTCGKNMSYTGSPSRLFDKAMFMVYRQYSTITLSQGVARICVLPIKARG